MEYVKCCIECTRCNYWNSFKLPFTRFDDFLLLRLASKTRDEVQLIKCRECHIKCEGILCSFLLQNVGNIRGCEPTFTVDFPLYDTYYISN